MAKISFIGNWSAKWQTEFNVPRGYLLIKPHEAYVKSIGAGLKKLNDDQIKKATLRDVDVTFDIHYMKRTLDQNATMHALYEIFANEENCGKVGKDCVTAWGLYNRDLMEYAPRIEMFVNPGEFEWIKTEYRIIDTEKYDKARNKYYLKIVVTTSHFNTVQMAQWLDMLFRRAAEMGVTNPNEIRDYWLKWRKFLSEEKIILHDDLTEDEYRQKNIICEACGSGQGLQLAHIKAGHHPDEHKPWNWLLLCHDCHIGVQHPKGFTELIKKASHLKLKVENALKGNF
jgi:hypothetical protein